MSVKKNLLVICCGKRALHQQWEELHTDYNFDLALLIFDGTDFEDKNSKAARFIFKDKGYKFENIAKFITKDIYRQYEQIGVIDHDVKTTPKVMNDLFDYGKSHNFDLYQPAYTQEGYPSHPYFMVADPRFDYRIFNTVEIMCPFFSQNAFNVIVNEFDTSPYKQGYGLEYAFEGLLGSYNGTTVFGGLVAVVDKYPVMHCDPIVQRLEVSEPDIWYYRHKYKYVRMMPFNRDIIRGVKE